VRLVDARGLTPAEFTTTGRGVTPTEKATAQSHLIDLCRLGEPMPNDEGIPGGD